jgi:hypothetical protein
VLHEASQWRVVLSNGLIETPNRETVNRAIIDPVDNGFHTETSIERSTTTRARIQSGSAAREDERHTFGGRRYKLDDWQISIGTKGFSAMRCLGRGGTQPVETDSAVPMSLWYNSRCSVSESTDLQQSSCRTMCLASADPWPNRRRHDVVMKLLFSTLSLPSPTLPCKSSGTVPSAST